MRACALARASARATVRMLEKGEGLRWGAGGAKERAVLCILSVSCHFFGGKIGKGWRVVRFSVFCVLCSVFCVLCSVYCVLCSVFCFLFSVVWISCSVFLGGWVGTIRFSIRFHGLQSACLPAWLYGSWYTQIAIYVLSFLHSPLSDLQSRFFSFKVQVSSLKSQFSILNSQFARHLQDARRYHLTESGIVYLAFPSSFLVHFKLLIIDHRLFDFSFSHSSFFSSLNIMMMHLTWQIHVKRYILPALDGLNPYSMFPVSMLIPY